MIVGYILIGMMVGFVAFVAALLSGATFWFALAHYSLVGAVGVIVAPLLRFALGAREAEADAAHKEDRADATALSPPSPSRSGDMALKRQESPAAPTARPEESARSLRILAVDDDPSILELLAMIAASAGYSDVTLAASGARALELLANTDTVFECLLFDINMPEIDGIALCARVRDIPAYRDTPIIMLTAMRDMKHMDRAFKAGATDYATKPFDITELTDRLRFAQEALLAQHRSAAAAKAADKQADRVSHHRFALADSIRLEGADHLADSTALGNYLTQLPRDRLGEIQVVAIKIDHIETIYATTTPDMFARILREVAGAIATTLDSRLMAYRGSGVFLVISDPGPLLPDLLEAKMREGLSRIRFTNRDADRFEVAVSIGAPVTPIEPKTKRAKITFARAITRAENRFYQKQPELLRDIGFEARR